MAAISPIIDKNAEDQKMGEKFFKWPSKTISREMIIMV